MMFIDKGRLLVDFDQDTRNFIDAAGLDNDANLNVDGLYSAEKARMAVHNYISYLKSYGLWNLIDVLTPNIGGTDAISKLNLKNPSDANSAGRLVFIDGTTNGTELGTGYYLKDSIIHNSNKFGYQGNALIGNISYDSSYDNNLTIGCYVYSKPTNDGRIYIGGGSSDSFSGFHDAVNYANKFGATYYDTPAARQGAGFGSCYYSLNGPTQVSLNNILMGRRLPQSFGSTTFAPNNTIFSVGFNSLNGTISNPNRGTTARVNCIVVGKYMTQLQLELLGRGTELFNAELNRSSIK